MRYIKDDLYVNTEKGKELSYLELVTKERKKITIGSKDEFKKTKVTRVVFSKAINELHSLYFLMFEYQIGSADTDEGKVTLNVDTDWYAVEATEYEKLLSIVRHSGFEYRGGHSESVAQSEFFNSIFNKYKENHEDGIPKELTLDDKDNSLRVVEKEYIVHDALITITSIKGKELTYKASEFTALTADLKLNEYAFYTNNEDYPHFIAKEDFYNLSDYFKDNEFLSAT